MNTRFAKQQNNGHSFRNGECNLNGIRTIVVLASVDDDDQQSTNKSSNKARRSLLSIIKSRGYACVPAMEKTETLIPHTPYSICRLTRQRRCVASISKPRLCLVF